MENRDYDPEVIDMTPEWSALVLPLLAVVEGAKQPESRRMAREEFANMAQAADAGVRVAALVNRARDAGESVIDVADIFAALSGGDQ